MIISMVMFTLIALRRVKMKNNIKDIT